MLFFPFSFYFLQPSQPPYYEPPTSSRRRPLEDGNEEMPLAKMARIETAQPDDPNTEMRLQMDSSEDIRILDVNEIEFEC